MGKVKAFFESFLLLLDLLPGLFIIGLVAAFVPCFEDMQVKLLYQDVVGSQREEA